MSKDLNLPSSQSHAGDLTKGRWRCGGETLLITRGLEVLVVRERGKGQGVGRQICFLGATSFILCISNFLKIIKGHTSLTKAEHQTSLDGLLLPMQGRWWGNTCLRAVWSPSCSHVLLLSIQTLPPLWHSVSPRSLG